MPADTLAIFNDVWEKVRVDGRNYKLDVEPLVVQIMNRFKLFNIQTFTSFLDKPKRSYDHNSLNRHV